MDLQDRLARMTKVVEQLEMEKLLQRDEICSLKAQARSHQSEISLLNRKVTEMEAQALQDAPATNVGSEVRLRYLELHRQRMGRPRQGGLRPDQGWQPRSASGAPGCGRLAVLDGICAR